MKCRASWLVEREGVWPGGSWQECESPPTHLAWLRVAEGVMVFLHFCDAHAELWGETIGVHTVSLPTEGS